MPVFGLNAPNPRTNPKLGGGGRRWCIGAVRKLAASCKESESESESESEGGADRHNGGAGSGSSSGNRSMGRSMGRVIGAGAKEGGSREPGRPPASQQLQLELELQQATKHLFPPPPAPDTGRGAEGPAHTNICVAGLDIEGWREREGGRRRRRRIWPATRDENGLPPEIADRNRDARGDGSEIGGGGGAGFRGWAGVRGIREKVGGGGARATAPVVVIAGVVVRNVSRCVGV
jgi:hypothetical protein